MIVGEREFETDEEGERKELRKQVLTAELPFEGLETNGLTCLRRNFRRPVEHTFFSPVETRAPGSSTTLKCLNIDGSVASVAHVTFDALDSASL